ncbi:uncharacterized protein GBIM_17501 [Gryllus bimaculatus]|nr:uncharacterized protein GBIM_17501 [Gryllus bimaculatus]
MHPNAEDEKELFPSQRIQQDASAAAAAALGAGAGAGAAGGGRGGVQRAHRGERPGRPSARAAAPVCGSDGVTYSSRCQLLRAQCKGAAVTVKHKGPCKDAQPCWTDLRHAQFIPRPPQLQLFEPRCLDDGSYAPVQCHNETGYCWCVTPQGRPGNRGPADARRQEDARTRKVRLAAPRRDNISFA